MKQKIKRKENEKNKKDEASELYLANPDSFPSILMISYLKSQEIVLSTSGCGSHNKKLK